MILLVVATLKEICAQGKDYPWTKPKACLRCKGSRLWGHGYVRAYFDGYEKGVLLRRYRCPECGCVIRAKPQGYWRGFQASIESIRGSITHRVKTSRYLQRLSRTRQAHWLYALKRRARAYLGDQKDLLHAFDKLIEMGRIPVSRSI